MTGYFGNFVFIVLAENSLVCSSTSMRCVPIVDDPCGVQEGDPAVVGVQEVDQDSP